MKTQANHIYQSGNSRVSVDIDQEPTTQQCAGRISYAGRLGTFSEPSFRCEFELSMSLLYATFGYFAPVMWRSILVSMIYRITLMLWFTGLERARKQYLVLNLRNCTWRRKTVLAPHSAYDTQRSTYMVQRHIQVIQVHTVHTCCFPPLIFTTSLLTKVKQWLSSAHAVTKLLQPTRRRTIT